MSRISSNKLEKHSEDPSRTGQVDRAFFRIRGEGGKVKILNNVPQNEKDTEGARADHFSRDNLLVFEEMGTVYCPL